MNHTRLFRTPENRDRLLQILSDPVFVAACRLVEERWRVEPGILFQTPLADPVVARKAAYHSAMQSFPEQLMDLAKTPSDKQPLGEAWDHIKLESPDTETP
jgi:hypothetical protein